MNLRSLIVIAALTWACSVRATDQPETTGAQAKWNAEVTELLSGRKAKEPASLLFKPVAVAGEKGATLSAEAPASLRDPFANPQDTAGLPRVLLIGDSISIGYTIPVRRLLAGKVNVHRIPVNGQATDYGLAQLQTWLGDGKWDVIHFNWGLWDICYRNPKAQTQGHRDKVNGTLSITPEQYRKNLEQLVAMLQHTKARLVWCSSTPVPDGEIGRFKGDEVKYNAIAAEIMKKQGILIDDLYAHALKRTPAIYVEAGNVHFSEAGYDYLAEAVAGALGKALGFPSR